MPTVTDGIGMGTEAMKYSLVSREVIADAIETSVNGQAMDGVLVVGGCDKNMPGGVMAMARMNVPAIYVYGGTIKPGKWKGKDLTIVSAFEAVGSFTAGKMSEEDFQGIEKNACPSVGACGGMYTANTMSSSFEALGVSLLGSSQMAAPDAREGRLRRPNRRACWSRRSSSDLKPRDIITRKSIENAIALVMATGGSTNAVLHYLAIASRRGREVDHRRLRARAPQGAGAVRPQALGALRGGRLPPRRRRAAGAEDPARERRAARRVHDHPRQDHGRDAEGRAGRAARATRT